MIAICKKITQLTFVLLANSIYSQDILGDWTGELKMANLSIVLHIDLIENTYNSTLDSPDQGAFGIPIDYLSFKNDSLLFSIASLNASFKGRVKKEYINGTFTQNGFSMPLVFARGLSATTKKHKPQEPQRPFPYTEEEITFNNGDIMLSGTFTKPNGQEKYPTAILINGSGPQDRDVSFAGHKPFLVIADYLTRNGIAVLRYDDRGYGKSSGNFATATTNDFALDVEKAFQYLLTRKDVNNKHIGLIGHSEGGIIAPIVAAKNKRINFIILLAGTGIPGDELLLLQQQKIGKVMGFTNDQLQLTKKINKEAFSIVTKNDIDVKSKLQYFLRTILDSIPSEKLPAGISNSEAFITNQVNLLSSPWMRYFLTYDPSFVLTKVNCPVMAINGSNDLQVPAMENLTAIETALKKGNNQQVTIRTYPDLNHMFQESKTGAPNEYAAIDQTIATQVLEDITKWITIQIKE